MKVLKKHGLTLVLLTALVVALTLGILFALPARSVSADEFTAEKTVNVSTEQQLKDEIANAGTAATKIVLEDSIVLQDGLRINPGQTIAIDLKGNTLSRKGWVIANFWAKLYLEDSSAEKTGTIADADTGTGTNVMGLVFNYGEMYSSVNYDVVYSSCVAVTNQLVLTGDDNTEYICNPSLTITGGTIKHRGNAQSGVTLLEVIDGDLTITGGTFITGGYQGSNSLLVDVSSTDLQPEFYPWDYITDDNTLTPEGQEKVDEALKELKAQLDVIRPHRQSTVTIEGGDFTAFSPKCGVIKVALNVEEVTEFRFGTYSTGWGKDVVGPYTPTFLITGGRWGRDLSGYVGDGYWMEHVQETSQSGEIIEDFYQVAEADQTKAEASVTVNGKERYYTTVSAAFDAVKTTVADEHTIQLLKNATAKIISLKNVSGDIVLDLNGHKLKVDPESQSGAHIDVSSDSSFKNRFVIRDTSVDQTGELELCASKGVSKQSFFYFYTGNTKVVLESGTIRQTGLLPESYKDYSTDNVTSSNDDYLLYMSLFKFAPTGLPSGYLSKYANDFQNGVTIKGGNIISEMNFGTADNIVTTHAGILVGFVGPNYNNNEFGLMSKANDKIPDKDKIIILDIEAYLADGTKSCKFSWDFNDLVAEKGLTSNPSGDAYIVSKVSEGENFIVGSSAKKVETLQAALEAAAENDTISVIQNVTVAEAVTIGRGIALNLNAVANFELTFEKGFTLLGGASIRYGKIIAQGAVTVAGDAMLENVTLNGDITVSGGTLTIPSGTYNGQFTINGEGRLSISGGSFKGKQIRTLDKYFTEHLGAFDENNKFDYTNNGDQLYTVKFGPNLEAQGWYQKFQNGVYEIGKTTEWLYFSLFVNGGIDSFKNKTVKLTEELDFDPNAASGIALVADAKAPNFLPAGNGKNAFAGTFDGNNKAMKNIVAQERAVGLFGYTTSDSRFRNIILKDSTFMTGSGTLDEFNGTGYLAGGAIMGEGFMSGNPATDDWSGNITLNNVKVGYSANAQNFNGGIIGHSWGNVYIDGLNFQNATTVSSNWKMGGIVGYLEGSFYIKKADIEEGTKGDGSDNGLILDDENAFFAAGALVGHANGSNNTIEDCKILEPDDSLIGTTYAGGTNGKITIKGSETDLDIYRVVGAGRAEGAPTEVELSQEVTGEGVKNSSVKLRETENGMKFYEVDEKTGKKEEVKVEANEDGGFEAVSKINVTIGAVETAAMTYAAANVQTLKLSGFVLYDELGNEIDADLYKNVEIEVTLEESEYALQAGVQVLLITSYTVSGADVKNFNFAPAGNQTFLQVTVNAAMLTVSVNENGEVVYDGFVGGEDESVLGGTLTLTKVDNGDGTYTVTPSGLESENYNIVYTSAVVSADVLETNSNALWIALTVVGSVLAVCGAAAIVFAIRKKRAE